MRDEYQEHAKQRRASLFIAAAMTLALVYMLVQLDLGGGDDAELPPPDSINAEAAFRIIVQPPAGDWLDTADPALLARRFRSAGAMWVMLRIPLWTASSRRAEYSAAEFMKLTATVRALRQAGLRIILAPVYWNGSALGMRPSPEMSKEFFLTYRGLALDMASLADESGADVLLLDGVFGDPAISAEEWLHLIAAMREAYTGMLEVRVDEGLTPAMYLTHLDGGYATHPVWKKLEASRSGEARAPLYLLMAESDAYVSGTFPWQPRLQGGTHDDEQLQTMLSEVDGAEHIRGIVLSGERLVHTLMLNEQENGLISSLRSLRQRRLVQDLGRTQGESIR